MSTAIGTYVERSGDRLPEGEDMLEFRLLYQGRLLAASRNDPRPEHKHDLRREFHRQLKRLWTTKSPLRERYSEPIVKSLNPDFSDPSGGFTTYVRETAERFSYHGYSFVPLVTKKLFLTCSLDILFLRPEEPSLLIGGGDIDNRIKTVFDSLRVPTVEEAFGLKDKYPPKDDEVPMFCLMEDDKLVSEVRATADHLLLLPNTEELGPNDVMLVVTVRVKPTRVVLGGSPVKRALEGINLDFA